MTDIQQIQALEAALMEAVLQGDADTLEDIYADAYTFTTPEGIVVSKAKFVEDVRSKRWQPILVQHSQQFIEQSGNTAVVRGLATYQWRNQKLETLQTTEQFCTTYTREYGTWHCLASAATNPKAQIVYQPILEDGSPKIRLFGAPSKTIDVLLSGAHAFPEPRTWLDGISSQLATKYVVGFPHSIAELVYHMNFWQKHLLQTLASGQPPVFPESESQIWAAVSAEAWAGLLEEFKSNLQAVKDLTRDEQALVQHYAFDHSLGYVLTDTALHNAYCFGQIKVLMELLADSIQKT